MATTTTASPSAGKKPRTTREAIRKVLDGSDEPMSAEAIYKEIRRRRLAPNLQGKTPAATVSAQLSIHGEFQRAGRGLYRLDPEAVEG